EYRSGVKQRSEGISRPRSFVTDAFLGPAAIVDCVIRLHRSNHFVARETRDVLGAQMLRVLNTKAAIAISVFLLDLFVNGKDGIVRAIADGVNYHLQSGFVGAAHTLEHRAGGKHLRAGNTACVGRIVVRIEKERGS